VTTDRSRVALVTGCGRQVSIGGAIARRLAAQGFRIVATDLPTAGEADLTGQALPAGLSQLVAAISADGGEAVAVTGDVTVPASAVAMVEAAINTYGRVDVLVNNAAAPPGRDRADLVEVDDAVWDSIMAVNLRGAFLMSRAVIPFMRARNYGRIVNIASMAGVIGAPALAAYSSSKAGLLGLTRSVSMDVARQGITVNAVCPSLVATTRTGVGGADPSSFDTFAEHIPLGRVATPDDISRVVAFFAGDDSAYVTGQFLAVDGGGPTTYELPPPNSQEFD
jgi:3-oxoacyl-[acyl-carrier protein] reductase